MTWLKRSMMNFSVTFTEPVMLTRPTSLRPRSIAFVLGVLPLAIASGAGSAARQAIGISVVGGMLTATFLAIFFVPLFFVLVLRLFRVRRLSERRDDDRLPPTATPEAT